MVEANPIKKSVSVLLSFYKVYPIKSVIIVFGQIASGLAENISLIALLPLIELLQNNNLNDTKTGAYFNILFDFFGITVTTNKILLLIVLLIVLKAVFAIIINLIRTDAVLKIAMNKRLELINAIFNAEWQFFTKKKSGFYSNLLSEEAAKIPSTYNASIALLTGIIQFGLYVSAAIYVSFYLTVISLISGIIMVLVLSPLLSIGKKAGKEQVLIRNTISNNLIEALHGIKVIKSGSSVSTIVEFLRIKINSLFLHQKKEVHSTVILNNIHEPMIILVAVVLLFVSINYLDIEFSAIAVIAILLTRTLKQIGVLQNQYHVIGVNLGSINLFQESIEHAENNKESHFGKKAVDLNRQISFKNAAISYGDKNILNNINITILPKTLTVIYGPSGGGKTSLVDTVLGLIDISKGNLEIDNCDINEINIGYWRSQISYVPQETFLFDDTIYENIVMGEHSISENEVVDVLKKSEAWAFVSSMKEGIYSKVGDKGLQLSGGQRQRLSIARALVKKPRLLILDEATSALDIETEKQLINTIKSISKDIAVLAVTHNHDLLDVADKKLIVEKHTIHEVQ